MKETEPYIQIFFTIFLCSIASNMYKALLENEKSFYNSTINILVES
jgi:hypothetical protein